MHRQSQGPAGDAGEGRSWFSVSMDRGGAPQRAMLVVGESGGGKVVLQKPGYERRVRTARGHLETRK